MSLRDVVVRSLGLYERIDLLRSGALLVDPGGHGPSASVVLARWEALLTRADRPPSSFERRLRFEGFDRASILSALGPIAWPEGRELPRWAEILEEVLLEMPRRVSDLVELDPDAAFVDYWQPWVTVAIRRFGEERWASLHADVRRALVQMLLTDLVRSGSQTLMRQLDTARDDGADLGLGNELFLRASRTEATDRASKEIYERLIAELHGPRAMSFLLDYPCLARLAAEQVEHWVAHVGEMLMRLDTDASSVGGGVRDLIAISPDLSDAHHGGRRVAIMTFANGSRIVYKPKDVAIEAAFQEALRRVNDLGFEPALRPIRVIAGRGYGWVEHVANDPCQSEGDLESYYVRAGGLLAIVTLLAGTDCHYENIIACGADPILVDHEALLTPTASAPEGCLLLESIQARLERSVLRTGLLPEWSVETDGTVVDLSGLGARRAPRAKSRMRLTNANTDRMSLVMVDDDFNPAEMTMLSVPHVAGKEPPPTTAFEAEVTKGFEEVLRLLRSLSLEERERVLLAPFTDVATRFIARATVGYGHLLRDSRRPERMVSGLARSIALERIAWMFLGEEDRPASFPLLRAEHEALERGDVPVFFTRAAETGIFERCPGADDLFEIAPSVFERPSLAVVREGLGSLGDDHERDLEIQLISASFSGKRVERASSAGGQSPHAAAVAIARDILARMIFHRGARFSVGLERVEGRHEGAAYQAALLGMGLYGGAPGVALFLGAASVVDSREVFREAALGSLSPFREVLRERPRDLIEGASPGGYDGYGGLLYTLGALARHTEDPSLVDDARLLISTITREDIDRAASFDVVAGLAGLVLALSSLRAVDPTNVTAPLVDHAARRLVRAAKKEASGVGWPLRSGGRSVVGMAHGGSGIALALMEAARMLPGDTRSLSECARGALEYERSLFEPERDGWPDLREEDDPHRANVMSTWCAGAPGIALARSRMLMFEDRAELRTDLELALRVTKSTSLRAEHLCCGAAGIDLVLYEVGRRVGDNSLVELSKQRTVARAERGVSCVHQGLLRGSAGIGLGFLHAAHDDLGGCVLDLSSPG